MGPNSKGTYVEKRVDEVKKRVMGGGTLDEFRIVLESCVIDEIPVASTIPDIPDDTEQCPKTIKECMLGDV